MLIIFIGVTTEIAVHFKSVKLQFNFIVKCTKRVYIGTVDFYEFWYMPGFLQYIKNIQGWKRSDIQYLITQEDNFFFRIAKFTKYLVNKGGTGFTTSCWNNYLKKKKKKNVLQFIKIFLKLQPFIDWE